MEFGVALPNFQYGAAPSAEHILAVCKAAEENGYTSALTSDHILAAADDARYGVLYESIVALAWLAGQTERIRLGTSILVLPMRHAVLAGKQLATLDALSGGRLIVGVGVGWNKGEYESLGASFHRRGACLDESIEVVRNLWREPTCSFQGDFYTYSGRRCDPKPTRADGPPIWVGGNSPAALARAARLGDAWHADEVMPDQFADGLRTLSARAAEAGRDAPGATVRFTVDLFAATGTERRAVPTAGHYMGGENEIGMRGSFALMRQLLNRYRRLGVSDFICQFEHDTPPQHVEFIRVFATEVMEQLQAA